MAWSSVDVCLILERDRMPPLALRDGTGYAAIRTDEDDQNTKFPSADRVP